ncbi:transmembrane protease serine 9-like [Musca autumnalis]|uniref:transmembrane protease serine 9-like n=1 Tax=Musca autumnalis TaxID=221902 RepID=UPI003CF72464
MLIIKINFLLVLCLQRVYSYGIKFPTVDPFPTECTLPDKTSGTCLNLLYCAAALTAKNITLCYTENDEQYVCCPNSLWASMKRRRITGDCGVPRYEIVRGLNTVYREFPYMAALCWDSLFEEGVYDYKCGGVLIWNEYVLTAAHCAILNGMPPNVVLVGGTNLTDSSFKPIKVAEVIRHPLYKPQHSYHDIALIKLEENPGEDRLCLWTLYPLDDVNVTAVGYGHTQFAGSNSESLLKTYLSIIPNKDCFPHYVGEDALPQGIVDSHLCAKDSERQSDTCQGDSGGPLILRSTSPEGFQTAFLVGITSFGRGCGFDKPGVYTRVSEYLDWIESVIFRCYEVDFKPATIEDFPAISFGLFTMYNEFPYMAALGWDSNLYPGTYDYKCGGVLITPKYVLTAAHCADLSGSSPSVALVGGVNLTDISTSPVKISNIIKHPKYKHNEPYNDIALLKLEENVTTPWICLWNQRDMPEITMTACGYGKEFFAGPGSDTLLKAHLSLMPNKECSEYYKNDTTLPQGILDTQLCARDRVNNSDTCQGDSGGPLIIKTGYLRTYLVGITSFGQGCSLSIPGVYTRVSEYLDWIEEVVYGKLQ